MFGLCSLLTEMSFSFAECLELLKRSTKLLLAPWAMGLDARRRSPKRGCSLLNIHPSLTLQVVFTREEICQHLTHGHRNTALSVALLVFY
jgi:hypothetical protein